MSILLGNSLWAWIVSVGTELTSLGSFRAAAASRGISRAILIATCTEAFGMGTLKDLFRPEVQSKSSESMSQPPENISKP